MPDDEDKRQTACYGKLTKLTKEADWETYTEQLEFYFLANNVKDAEKKKAILLANLSPETYQLVKDLLMPNKLSDNETTYDTIVQRLKAHVKPEKSAIVARFDFDNRHR